MAGNQSCKSGVICIFNYSAVFVLVSTLRRVQDKQERSTVP